MYNGSLMAVRSGVRVTKEFIIKVGLYKGSPLSLFLFAVVMDRMTDDIHKVSPCNMLFAIGVIV